MMQNQPVPESGPSPAGAQSGGIAASPSMHLKLSFITGVLLVAAAGYSLTGSPRHGDQTALASRDGAAVTAAPSTGTVAPAEDHIADIVERLAQRLNDNPDDAAGWTLLARAYSAMGRYGEAVQAYRKALPLAGESADLLADYADTLAGQNGGKLTAEATRQVSHALSLDSKNPKAMALAGRAAFDAKDFTAAVRMWESVAAVLPPDSALRAPLQDSISQARQLGGLAVATTPASFPPDARSQAGQVGQAEALSGKLSLAPGLAAKASPNDTVFVFAKAESGNRVPLAVLRVKVSDLPLDFTLDDSMAMSSSTKISSHAKVVVSARISKSGDALPQAGDLTGQSKPVAPGTRQLNIRISDVVGSTATAARQVP